MLQMVLKLTSYLGHCFKKISNRLGENRILLTICDYQTVFIIFKIAQQKSQSLILFHRTYV